MTATSFEVAIERLHRVTFWARGYRTAVERGAVPTVHTAGTRDSKLPGGEHAWLEIQDVEWLLQVAKTAQAAADEARDEMGKGRGLLAGRDRSDSGFREDFPATARLVDLFEDGDET